MISTDILKKILDSLEESAGDKVYIGKPKRTGKTLQGYLEALEDMSRELEAIEAF
ncbi:MAG: hypothetical protein IBX64_10120 [Actinobacteria bacterium]|nr:hypothetical protein [Actinomycetota bacterium]